MREHGGDKNSEESNTCVEISVNIFDTENVIVASGDDHYIDKIGNNDLEILR